MNCAQVEPGRDDVRLGHPADRVVGADDLGVGALAVRELGAASCRGCPSRGSGRRSSSAARAGAGTGATSARASARSRSGRRRSVGSEPRERRELRARAVAAAPPCRSSDQSASGCSLPRLKTTSRASTPLRRSACTFSHGIPATLTGQCVTRSVRGPFHFRTLRHSLVTVSDTGSRLGTTPRPGARNVPHGVRHRAVELELVEVAQRRSAGADARRERAQLVVRDLAERALDAEVRQVQILLVDDRRDARVDLDHVLADELDVEEVLDPELGDDRVRRAPSAPGRRASRSTSRARRASPRASSGGRARSRGRSRSRRSSARGPSRAPSRAARCRSSTDARISTASSSRIETEPGPLAQQLVGAVDGRVEDAEAARAGREHRLEADRPLGVAELARRGLDLAPRRRRGGSPAPEARAGAGARTSPPCRSSGGSRRATRRAPAIASKRSTCAGEPFEVERRLRQDRVGALALGDLAASRPGSAGSAPAGHEVERVAEVAADRALAHVGADEPHLALAVLAQRAQERRRARARPTR